MVWDFLSLLAKAASVRALLFDISFLMLCHVAQTYGSEVGSPWLLCYRMEGTEGDHQVVRDLNSGLLNTYRRFQVQLLTPTVRAGKDGGTGSTNTSALLQNTKIAAARTGRQE